MNADNIPGSGQILSNCMYQPRAGSRTVATISPPSANRAMTAAMPARWLAKAAVAAANSQGPRKPVARPVRP